MLQALGDIALATGNIDLARQHYRRALEGALDYPSPEPRLHLLLGPARLLSRQGEMGRAIELAALAQHHRESVEETRIRAEGLLDQLRAQLAPDVYALAMAQGKARDLEATVGELLDELSAVAGPEADIDMEEGRDA
jgi:hypothetical protein